MKILINENPRTKWEIAAKAGHDLLKRAKWIWRANRTVAVPDEIVEEMGDLIRLTMEEGNKIAIRANKDTLETIIEWLRELQAWGFKDPDWPVPEAGIPDK